MRKTGCTMIHRWLEARKKNRPAVGSDKKRTGNTLRVTSGSLEPWVLIEGAMCSCAVTGKLLRGGSGTLFISSAFKSVFPASPEAFIGGCLAMGCEGGMAGTRGAFGEESPNRVSAGSQRGLLSVCARRASATRWRAGLPAFP